MDLLNWKDVSFKMVSPTKQLSQNMDIKDYEITMIYTIIISQSYYIIFFIQQAFIDHLCIWLLKNIRKDRTGDKLCKYFIQVDIFQQFFFIFMCSPSFNK